MSDPCILQTPFHSTEIYRYRCACIIQKRNWGWFWGHCVLFPAVVLIKSSISVWKGVCLKSALHWSTLTHATAHAQSFYTVVTLFKQYFCKSADFSLKKKKSLSRPSYQHLLKKSNKIRHIGYNIHFRASLKMYETKLNCKMYHYYSITIVHSALWALRMVWVSMAVLVDYQVNR